jgi:hypothetical protein
MSRYVCHFFVQHSPEMVRAPLRQLMESCRMEMVYEIEDYMMAREIPGGVSFSKLVTIEVLIDITNATEEAVTLSFVVKNEELPLNSNNHCRQMFDMLRVALEQHKDWHPITSVQPLSAAIANDSGPIGLEPLEGSG